MRIQTTQQVAGNCEKSGNKRSDGRRRESHIIDATVGIDLQIGINSSKYIDREVKDHLVESQRLRHALYLDK